MTTISYPFWMVVVQVLQPFMGGKKFIKFVNPAPAAKK